MQDWTPEAAESMSILLPGKSSFLCASENGEDPLTFKGSLGDHLPKEGRRRYDEV